MRLHIPSHRPRSRTLQRIPPRQALQRRTSRRGSLLPLQRLHHLLSQLARARRRLPRRIPSRSRRQPPVLRQQGCLTRRHLLRARGPASQETPSCSPQLRSPALTPTEIPSAQSESSKDSQGHGRRRELGLFCIPGYTKQHAP